MHIKQGRFPPHHPWSFRVEEAKQVLGRIRPEGADLEAEVTEVLESMKGNEEQVGGGGEQM